MVGGYTARRAGIPVSRFFDVYDQLIVTNTIGRVVDAVDAHGDGPGSPRPVFVLDQDGEGVVEMITVFQLVDRPALVRLLGVHLIEIFAVGVDMQRAVQALNGHL